jgi:uncharacterized membrane protein
MIAAVVAIFTLTILPMIIQGTTLPRLTTWPMVVGSAVLAAIYATLGLWTSVLIEVLALIGWTILLTRTFKHGT